MKKRDALSRLKDRAKYYHWEIEPAGHRNFFVTSPYFGVVVPFPMTIPELKKFFDELDLTDRR